MESEFVNPFLETKSFIKTADSCIMVIFGATGDLTARRLVPALYNLAREGQLPSQFACIGFARRDKSHEDFRKEMYEAIKKFSRTKPIDEEIWNRFKEGLFYHRAEFHEDQGYESLGLFMKKLDDQLGTKGNRTYYLSTPPSYFTTIVEKLGEHKLIYDIHNPKWSRVIVEKPFGHNLTTAIELQKQLTHYLDESQIYRIDHWLGKETVQNILIFRFGNPIFESVWNKNYIDNIQITVGEEIGVGTRGKFFEEAGMLRDIVQNHMMQLLSLVAMEPPVNMKADAIRDEKVKVVEAMRQISKDEIDEFVIRGQYGSGFSNGEKVPGYREEENVPEDSSVETYAAMELYVDNWRWSGVPFYMRAGKRLPKRASEIAITFKETPGFIFKDQSKPVDANVLVIRIQPDEGLSLKMNCKVPGLSTHIQPVKMDFKYSSYFGASPPDAYERLICDCMSGDKTLFAHVDEVIASWRLFSPVIDHWLNSTPINFPNYQAGTWGPEEADKMLEKEGRKWRNL